MKLQTRCVHQNGPLLTDGDIVTPVHTSVIFAMRTPSSVSGAQYGRIHNKTRASAESVLAGIHNAKFGITASSGSAAITAVCLLLHQKSIVLHHTELYEGTRRILRTIMQPFGVTAVPVNFHNVSLAGNEIAKIKPSLVWLETPTNPSLRLLDIARIAAITRKNGALLAVDTTMCSGLLQQPLVHGADIVVESLTKNLNGHSDALGGFVGTNNKNLAQKLRFLIQTTGMVLDPVSASLILRGIKTAPVRIKAQQQSAQTVGKWLSHHPLIRQVLIPGKMNSEERLLLRRQMSGRGQLISFILKQHADPISTIEKLRLICIAHSFGGTETIIQHPASMMDWSRLTEQLPDRQLLRLSVGLEHPEDIINDLKQALEQ